MNIIELHDLDCEGIGMFANLTEAQLRNAAEADSGIFIAESPKVIRVALACGMQPVALLCEERHINGDAADIIARCPDIPVYTGSRELLCRITGYTLTRGVLCAMRRPQLPTVAVACAGAPRVAVIDGVCDTTNIGAIFRSASALGVGAVLLTPTSCDPLNRRAVRVSMGTVFTVPWTYLPAEGAYDILRESGYKIAALALSDNSVPIDDAALCAEPRLALVLGTEGDGLSRQAIEGADYVARIPMSHGVDSLNVAAASAVAFWATRHRSA